MERWQGRPLRSSASSDGAFHRSIVPYVQSVSLRSRPVISGGGSMSSIRSTVGPTSHRALPWRSRAFASHPRPVPVVGEGAAAPPPPGPALGDVGTTVPPTLDHQPPPDMTGAGPRETGRTDATK